MKKIKISAVVALLLLGTTACKDNFYDLKPYDSVPFGEAVLTQQDMGVAMNGVYSGLRFVGLYGRTIPFVNDLFADNVYISARNSGRYLPHYNYSLNSQNGDTGGTWAAAYTVILRANNVINSTVAENDLVKQYKGEAYAARALMHYELVKMFAKPYTQDPNALGVPVVTTFDAKSQPARNTVKEVYTAIVADLTKAFDLMKEGTRTGANSSYLSKYAAKALLAKVYFNMGDYTNALAAANDVLTAGGYTLVGANNYASYWANAVPVSNKLETIFEVASDAVNNAGFDSLVNMYAQLGYGDGLATTDLYNLYSSTDVRRNLIISGTRNGEAAYIINKYSNISNANDRDDFKVVRLSEILLIAAESAARTGKEADALASLNRIISQRDLSAKPSTATGADLIEAIITERRKELAFEGNRYTDLLRLNRAVARNTQYPAAARRLEANDSRRIMPIPQAELDANPNIKQNDGY